MAATRRVTPVAADRLRDRLGRLRVPVALSAAQRRHGPFSHDFRRRPLEMVKAHAAIKAATVLLRQLHFSTNEGVFAHRKLSRGMQGT